MKDTPAPARPARLGGVDLALYAMIVFAWGTSWISIRYQVATVAPEVSVVWRFLISAPVMALLAYARGESFRFAPALHLRFAALGAVLFSTNFVLFYHGGQRLPSGLLSVVFSLASITNLLLAWAVFGQRPGWRLAVGAALGAAGVAAMFEPQFERAPADGVVLAGLLLCIAGTVSFSTGNMISTGLQRARVPVLSSSAFGMAYGALFAALLAAGLGRSFSFDTSLPYVLSLLHLAVIASVLAFASYLTLLGRIGPARAGYATVLFPAVAVAVSVVVEGYPFNALVAAGFALVALGNLMVMRR